MSDTITDRDGNVCRVGDSLTNAPGRGPIIRIVAIDDAGVTIEWIGPTASGRVPSRQTIQRTDFADRTHWRLWRAGLAEGVR